MLYESHQVQDKAHDTILKKIDQDPEWFLHLLVDAREFLSSEAYRKYYDNGLALYEESKDQYLRKSIQAQYARFQEQELYNGNTPLFFGESG